MSCCGVISLSLDSLLLLVLEHSPQVLEAVMAPGHPGSLMGGHGRRGRRRSVASVVRRHAGVVMVVAEHVEHVAKLGLVVRHVGRRGRRVQPGGHRVPQLQPRGLAVSLLPVPHAARRGGNSRGGRGRPVHARRPAWT